MPRLFTAIPIPSQLATQLLALVPESPDLRLVPPQNLHLTLHFLGEVSAPRTVELAEALAEIPVPRVSVQLSTGGMFCDAAGAGVLWVGLKSAEGVQMLRDLQQRQRDVLQRMGLRCEDREWQPHVTVARYRQANESLLQQFLLSCRDLALPAEIGECTLWESSAGPGHSTYTARQHYQSQSQSSAP